MTRMAKQAERRAVSPRRPKPPAKKTGSKKDKLEHGFKLHANAVDANGTFIPKIR